MENDASADEYEDDLEAEEELEDEAQPEVSEVVCDPVETAATDGFESDEVEEGDSQVQHDVPIEEGKEVIADREDDLAAHASPLTVPDDTRLKLTSPRQEEEPGQQTQRRGPKNLAGQSEGKDLQIALLTKKLSQAKKINAELHTQLQHFFTNDVVFQLKEQYRVADERGFKLHQQSFDLTIENKGLSEKVRLLEGATMSMSLLSPASSSVRIGVSTTMEGTPPEDIQAILASQEEEITRLHQRVALMKKTHKADHAKYERLLKASQDEIEQARVEMEDFYQQQFAKERAARNQFLHMKKLKRALHELASTQQTNQRFQSFLMNREMRLTNRSSSSRHHHVGQHSPSKGPALNPGRWIHEALHHLGFVMPLSSHLDGSTKSLVENVPDEQVDIPENCIQGRLVPFPPPTTVDREFIAGSTSTRAQFYDNLRPQGGGGARNNDDSTDVSEQTTTAEYSNEEDQVTAVTPSGTTPENPDGLF
ncbi:unnamed protein product [Phytophthora lilii]|uniref:Unnamed protein product n=1 Tax=Phytophthora lilii TaxID=2077276 RepID=A0A9W6UCM4_9STRA|nr:unnamed protein product [Phytophthora lilii]